jgi:hypothetical protein
MLIKSLVPCLASNTVYPASILWVIETKDRASPAQWNTLGVPALRRLLAHHSPGQPGDSETLPKIYTYIYIYIYIYI